MASASTTAASVPTPLVRVTGTLEFVQHVVAECRREFEAVRATKPEGLLPSLLRAFSLYENPKPLRKRRRVARSTSSRETGTRVHSEIEMSASGTGVLRPHPFTVKVSAYFREKGWALVASEVPLPVPELRMATRIDSILYCAKTDEVLLVELKTGYDTGYRAELDSLRSFYGLPSADVPDTHCNRAHMQLAWMYWRLQSKFAVPRLRPIVVLVNGSSRKAKHEELADWARADARVIYKRACEQRASELPG